MPPSPFSVDEFGAEATTTLVDAYEAGLRFATFGIGANQVAQNQARLEIIEALLNSARGGHVDDVHLKSVAILTARRAVRRLR